MQEIKKGQVWHNIHNNHKVTIDKIEDDFVYLVGGYVTDALSFIDNWKIESKESLFGITEDKVVQAVMNNLNERSKVGVEKYNTTMERTDIDLLGWLNHLQEELMDATIYIERLKKEVKL